MRTDLRTVLAAELRIMNAYAPHYERAPLTNSYVYRMLRSQFVEWCLATLHDEGRHLASLSLLEAGSGTGSMLEQFGRAGIGRTIGIDLADGMIAEARKRKMRNAVWLRGLIEQPPFRPNSFDVIVAAFTLHHLHDVGAFFRLVDETLRPGGWFFALEYNGGAAIAEETAGTAQRRAGDRVRALFARKNRRILDSLPNLEVLLNPGHRLLRYSEIQAAMATPHGYRVSREVCGLLLPTLLKVLVEESRFDRALARGLDAVDRWLVPHRGGLFQRIAGQRLPASSPRR